ncbi:MAG TPA: YeeE/YedE thiosulfate transporter family protein [Candidatus Eremiobacteraeota bacterium]|nr:YeeE/YedE thiosulfate transporter family protein [Candidatus Eremiobacteraeota bacterium]
MNILNLFFGILFGFILSRVGATQYDFIANMFLLKNLHLMGVIGSGIIAGAIGIQIIKRAHLKTITGEEIKITPKDRHWGNVIGGLIFGLGWGVTGSCPGTILTQLGEGKLAALFTLAGMILGTYLFGIFYPKLENFVTPKK